MSARTSLAAVLRTLAFRQEGRAAEEPVEHRPPELTINEILKLRFGAGVAAQFAVPPMNAAIRGQIEARIRARREGYAA